MSSSEIARVVDLRDGEPGRVRGRVRRARDVLTSPLAQRTCVFWEVHEGLDVETARSREAVDFWLEDDSGQVLVRADRIEVEARMERRQRVLGQVDKDIHEVSRRQRAVKDSIRRGEGDPKSLHAERRGLAELATLLCAVRAQARGRVHVGDTLRAQQAWITSRAKIDAEGASVGAIRLAIDEWEVALEEGTEIEVEGVCAREPAPGGLGGSYRDQATCLVLRATQNGSVIVRGLGAASVADTVGRASSGRPRRAPVARRAERRHVPSVEARGTMDRAVVTVVTTVCTVASALAWWLTH